MTEKEVHDFCKSPAITGDYRGSSDERIRLIHVSGYNHFSGPDFELAGFLMHGIYWFGPMEVHLESKDWYRHRHHLDPAYDHVALHIVLHSNATIYNSVGRSIPEIQLQTSFIKQHIVVRRTSHPNKLNFPTNDKLKHYAKRRMERKAKSLYDVLPAGHCWKQIFYRSVGVALGAPANGHNLLQLTNKLPIGRIEPNSKNLTHLFSMVFGMAGYLHVIPTPWRFSHENSLLSKYCSKYQVTPMLSKQWKKSGMRPASQVPNLLLKLSLLIHQDFFKEYHQMDQYELSDLISVLEDMKKHDNPFFPSVNLFTDGFVQSMMINAICPFLYSNGIYYNDENLKLKALSWLEQLDFECNRKTRTYIKKKRSSSALISQGILEWKMGNCENPYLATNSGREKVR